MPRISKIFKFIEEKGLDCVVVKGDNTIRYLTEFTGDSSILFADNRRAVLITDGRYVAQAKKEAKYCQIVEHTGNIWEQLKDIVLDSQKVVGFDGDIFSYEDYNNLKVVLGDAKDYRSTNFNELRIIKDDRELESIWKACKISEEALLKLLEELKPGISEKTVAGRLEYYMRSLGSERLAFPTIVASGVRSALPHGIASDKEIEVGDFITFDFGAVYNGYCADITRTVVLGMANSWHKEIYDVVEEAQWRGLKAVKEGMTCAELDAVVRDYIVEQGFGNEFVHGLGHGLGLEIHELPYINKRSNIVLEKGMTFTIEPGIYIPNKGGVRIEDTVVLTDEGATVMTSGIKKQLMEIV